RRQRPSAEALDRLERGGGGGRGGADEKVGQQRQRGWQRQQQRRPSGPGAVGWVDHGGGGVGRGRGPRTTAEGAAIRNAVALGGVVVADQEESPPDDPAVLRRRRFEPGPGGHARQVPGANDGLRGLGRGAGAAAAARGRARVLLHVAAVALVVVLVAARRGARRAGGVRGRRRRPQPGPPALGDPQAQEDQRSPRERADVPGLGALRGEDGHGRRAVPLPRLRHQHALLGVLRGHGLGLLRPVPVCGLRRGQQVPPIGGGDAGERPRRLFVFFGGPAQGDHDADDGARRDNRCAHDNPAPGEPFVLKPV
ncbi:unnamed protein product, partial [Scytosiphon promiscuus]